MDIRQATAKDFESLYKLGLATPEFQVSGNSEFMENDEFLSAIQNPNGIFLLAEFDGGIAGFIYANMQDPERGPKTKWACLVYLVVEAGHRKDGIAQRLYAVCFEELKKSGVNRLYGWANAESDGSVINFLKKNGFNEGHKYVWMDKKI